MNVPCAVPALAAALVLTLGGCERGPSEPDPAPPSAAVIELRLLGSPGAVEFAGGVVVYRTDVPPLALTLMGTTTEPPGTSRLGEDIERVSITLVKSQQLGTLRVELLANSVVIVAASTSDPFGELHLDVQISK
jgi:hypothetical protein